jgi:hypothetical protein
MSELVLLKQEICENSYWLSMHTTLIYLTVFVFVARLSPFHITILGTVLTTCGVVDNPFYVQYVVFVLLFRVVGCVL